MSRAEPMDADRRALNYVMVTRDGEHLIHAWTGPQRRRWKHKLHRTGEQWPADGKNRPTPRQRKPVTP